MSGRVRAGLFGAAVVIGAMAGSGGVAAAATAPPATTASSFSTTSTPGPSATPWCLPAALSLQQSGIVSTSAMFQVTVRVTSDLCEPLTVAAAIYAMPPAAQGEWPQSLASRTDVVLSTAGTTTFTFHKGCSDDQFDLIVGATPSVIGSGFDHGPMLFPFDLATAQQWRGGPCAPAATTTTVAPAQPTTTIATATTLAPSTTTTMAASARDAVATPTTSTPIAVADRADAATPVPVSELAFTGTSAGTPALLALAISSVLLGAALLALRRRVSTDCR